MSGPKGKVNLERIRDLGTERKIISERGSGDVVIIQYCKPEDVSASKLKAFLLEHLVHFQQVFES
ncbi:hypothetical protein EBX93_16985 [bacterium]|nr:hypothetical protein [bacterium]